MRFHRFRGTKFVPRKVTLTIHGMIILQYLFTPMPRKGHPVDRRLTRMYYDVRKRIQLKEQTNKTD